MVRGDRAYHASVCHHHSRAGARTRQADRDHGSGAATEWRERSRGIEPRTPGEGSASHHTSTCRPWGYHAFALLSPSDRRRRCDRDQTNADVPDPEAEGPKELITGFLFGTTGATIALSAVGQESGAHINPVVTMAFWLFRRLDSRIVIRYFGGLAGLLRTFCFCHTLIICYRTTRYVASKPFTTTWHPACSYSDHGPSNADNGGSSATQGGDHSGAAIAHAAAGDLR